MTQMTTLSGAGAGRFIFGTMQFGGRADETASRHMYDTCRAAGIVQFDTAHVYTDGASETLLGQFIAAEREKVLITSKVGYTGGAGADTIRTQFDISRRRLGVDVVDVLYLHRFDPDTDLHETFEAFAALRAAGAIRYVGLSNFAAWQVMKAQTVARGFDLRVDVLQPMYSLVKRQAEVEILPMCADQDIAVASYSPLGGGLLTGKYGSGGTGRLTEDPRYGARYGQDWMYDAAQGLSALAQQLGVDPATLAVAWAARHCARPMPILSARSSAQLAPSLAAMTYDMGDALYTQIAALSPAPPPATDRIEEQT